MPSLTKVSNGIEVPLTQAELEIEAAKEIAWQEELATRASTQYKIDRLKERPSVEDLLDLLWHAMDEDKLPKDNQFYTTLKAINDKYPKPKGA